MVESDDIHSSIDLGIDNILCELYKKYGVKSRDIEPHQHTQITNTVYELSVLFAEMINQNMELGNI